MKRKDLCMLVVVLVSCVQANAQKVLLPFGQLTKQPWTATYFLARSGDAGPSDDWFAKDFNDASWLTIEGPISTAEGAPPYYKSTWDSEYATYWVRRHFSVDRLSELRDVLFYAIHDDYCIAYLNGTQIYENYYVASFPNVYSITFDENMKSLLVEGDNVLAVCVRDNGSYSFMDNGIYAYSLSNGAFNDSYGWTGNFDRCNRDGNTIAYRYGNTLECQQTIADAPAGLYRLSANACGLEYYNDFNTALSHKNDEIPTKLFINNVESPIPSAFTETADYDYGYCWDMDGQFVPYYVDGTTTAFRLGMYRCEVWSFYEQSDNGLTVGIHANAQNDISRWASWDNMDLDYFTESEVTDMLNTKIGVMNGLAAKHQNAEVAKQTATLLTEAATVSTYLDKSRVFADMVNHEKVVLRSIEAYERLETTRQQLAEALKGATSFTSPSTIAEATALNQAVATAYESGTYSNNDVSAAIAQMNKMIERLTYCYFDITISTPGSMGDSILAKVDNFVDVKSLKVSGALDDNDLTTIRERLTELREIDMTGVKMTVLPNSFFYQHRLLEIVLLPTSLTTIGEYAFYQCSGLKHIDLPASLTTIQNYAFSECDNLQEAVLHEGITSVGDGAFYSCDNIQYAKLPSTLTFINPYTFYYNVALKTVEFSEGLTHIYNDAFYNCYALNNVKFPNSLYYIGSNAFAYNRSLSDLTFNEGLHQLADNAFYDCDALTEVTLPSSLVLAHPSPFDYCDNLTKVTCLSIEPPYMTDQIPYGLGMEGRELYVPELSLNVYKQTSGWDRFQTIKPIDYLPENITVLGDLRLTLPENIPSDYKPNVSIICDKKESSYILEYGALTVNGSGVLSISDFSMYWDPNFQYNYSDRVSYSTLLNTSHLRADHVSIDLYPKTDRWLFFSMPYDVKVSDIVTICEGTTNWIIRKYDGQKRAAGETADTWVKMGVDDVLNAGEGYILQGSRYIGDSWQDYCGFRMTAVNNGNKNNIFTAADVTVPLQAYESEFAHNRSWNLIGNPYPCYYDTRYMDFSAPITVWNPWNSTYVAYSTADDAYILSPGEAFFVQRPVETANIVFSKEGRQTDPKVQEHESGTRAAAQVRTVVNLFLTDGKNTDRTRVVLNGQAATRYEVDKDASKFMSSDVSVPQIYTVNDGVNYAINERPFGDGNIALAVRIGSESIYTISVPADFEECQVVLEDKAENKQVLLTGSEGYTFTAKAGTYANRFVLHFGQDATGIQNVQTDNDSDNSIYTLGGIKTTAPAKKGLYIQKGKKLLLNK